MEGEESGGSLSPRGETGLLPEWWSRYQPASNPRIISYLSCVTLNKLLILFVHLVFKMGTILVPPYTIPLYIWDITKWEESLCYYRAQWVAILTPVSTVIINTKHRHTILESTVTVTGNSWVSPTCLWTSLALLGCLRHSIFNDILS